MGTQTVEVMKELNFFVAGKVKLITRTTARILEQDTPELTGFAESNWVPQIGGERTATSGTRQAVDFNALETGIALVDTTYRLPELVYISNPVSYINTLNAGSSAKAPKYFVQTAIAKSIKSII